MRSAFSLRAGNCSSRAENRSLLDQGLTIRTPGRSAVESTVPKA
jgi:hypothetical protein